MKKCDGNCASSFKSGIVGLAKAALVAAGLPVDDAPKRTVKSRLDQCRGCEHATRDTKFTDRPSKGLTVLSQCNECGCFVYAKTLLASEKCPIGKW